jgi:hypothetical protein
MNQPYITLSCGAVLYLSEKELAAWAFLLPEGRWQVLQFSPVAARIILNAEYA